MFTIMISLPVCVCVGSRCTFTRSASDVIIAEVILGSAAAREILSFVYYYSYYNSHSICVCVYHVLYSGEGYIADKRDV